MQLSHLPEDCTTFTQGRKTHTKVAGCAHEKEKQVCNTRLIWDDWTSTMNDGKVISQILTVAIWSAGSIGLPFNLLCFFNLLGARIFKAKLNVVSRWARSDGCISWPCLVERLLMVLWCLAWVAVDELLTLQGSIFCTNTRVSMPFIPTGPKTWRDLWIGRCLSPRVTRSLSWSFFSF